MNIFIVINTMLGGEEYKTVINTPCGSVHFNVSTHCTLVTRLRSIVNTEEPPDQFYVTVIRY